MEGVLVVAIEWEHKNEERNVRVLFLLHMEHSDARCVRDAEFVFFLPLAFIIYIKKKAPSFRQVPVLARLQSLSKFV